MKCTVGGFFLKVPEVFLLIARAFPCYTKLYLLRCFSAVSEIRIITLYLALHALNTPLALERVMGEKEGSGAWDAEFSSPSLPPSPLKPKAKGECWSITEVLVSKHLTSQTWW